MQYKYIADLHLFDPDSLDWRTHMTLDSYANLLVSNWNSIITPADFIFIVGDVGNYCQQTLDVLHSLKGTKILIIGNHDESWGNYLYSCKAFQGIYSSIDTEDMYVTHIPPKTRSQSKVTIHGHHHDYFTSGMMVTLREYAADTYRYNCAADLIGNKPCTLQELILHKELLLDKAKDKGYI